MKKLLLFLVSTCILILSLAFAQEKDARQPAQPSVALPGELARVLTDYEKAWGNKDAPGLAQLFAEDGLVLSPGHPMVRGRAAIEQVYVGSGGPLSLRAVAFAVEGSIAYIIGAYGPSPGAPDDGKFTLTLRRGPSGRWLIVSDMDNGNHARTS